MYDTPVHSVPSLSPKPEVTISNSDLYDPPTSHDHDITSYDNLTPRLMSDASPGLSGFHDNTSSDNLNPKLTGESSPSFAGYHDPTAESTSDKAALVSRGLSPSHDLSGARESFLNPVPQKKARPSGHERAIYIIRLALRILSLMSSAAILGVLLHVLIRYSKTRDLIDTDEDTGIRLRVWPAGLKLWPTNLLLGAAATATLLSFILCMASFSKQIRRLTKRGHVFTLVVSAIGFVLWAAATIYFKVWDSKDMKSYDLWSWTCTHKDYDFNDIDLAPLCKEMQFTFYGACAVGGIEVLAILTVAWGISVSKRKYKRVGVDVTAF